MAKRTQKTQRKKPAAKAASSHDRGSDDHIIDVAMGLAAEKGWHRVALQDIAGEAGLGLSDLYSRFPSKGAILDAFTRRVDRATLAGVELPGKEDSGSVRDRLFDLIMRRFDALEAYKAAVASLARDLPRTPLQALCVGSRLCRSVSWMAAAAGVDTSGPLGLLRVKALTALYLAVLRVWLGDDSADHSKTMARLDEALKRAEMFAQSAPFQAFKRAG